MSFDDILKKYSLGNSGSSTARTGFDAILEKYSITETNQTTPTGTTKTESQNTRIEKTKLQDEREAKSNINTWINQTNALITSTNSHFSSWNNNTAIDTSLQSRVTKLLDIADYWRTQYADDPNALKVIDSVVDSLTGVSDHIKTTRERFAKYDSEEAYNEGMYQVESAGYDSADYYSALVGVVRDAETIQKELEQAQAELGAILDEEPTTLYAALSHHAEMGADVPVLGPETTETAAEEVATHGKDVLAKKEELEKKLALLKDELFCAQYVNYLSLRNADNFSASSQYVQTGKTRTTPAGETRIEGGDAVYEYINDRNGYRNSYNRSYANMHSEDLAYDGTSDLQDAGYDYLIDDEIAVYNYLYATQGKEAANQFLSFMATTLTARMRDKTEKSASAFAEEHPFWASVMTFATIPARSLAYVGQFFDYMGDGKIDENASYNSAIHITNAIRSTVSEKIQNSGKWGTIGSFAYETGMGLGDFLLTTAIAGGNQTLALAIMGTGAAASTTIEAKDRGLSDNQAFALGTIAGAAEILTEKIGLDALFDTALKGKSKFCYFLKNALGEAIEEPTSSLINHMADIYIAGDKSQFEQSVQAYMENEGLTEGEAFAKATLDQAKSLGTDFLGGLASGSAVGGGRLAVDYVASAAARNATTQPQSAAQPLDTVDTRNIPAVENTATAPSQLPQAAPSASSPTLQGTAGDMAISGNTPASPMSVYESALALGTNAAQDPVADAISAFRQTGTVTNKQAQDILNNSEALAYLREQVGLELPDTLAGRRAAVKAAVERLVQLQAGSNAQTTTVTEQSGIKEQLRSKQDALNTMQPAAEIQTPTEFAHMDKASKQNWVIEKLRPTGYKVDRKGFGIIEFAKKRLKKAFRYFDRGSVEELSFEALPYVLEKGIEISEHPNHKSRNYDTVTIAAPVIINGKRGNMAVVVKQTNGNQYKVHRILTPDGSVFQLPDITIEAEPTGMGESPKTGPLATSKGSASTGTSVIGDATAGHRQTQPLVPVPDNSISQSAPDVNTVSERVAQPDPLELVQDVLALGQGKELGQAVDTETQAEYDNSENTITDDEKAALLAYKSGGSYQLNAKLRDGIELDEQQRSIVNGLDSALPKLPVYKGTVYRNLLFDDFGGEEARISFIAAHAIGDVVTYDAFTSSSSQIDGYPVEGDFPVHIEIQSANGRNLAGYGNNFESEVLFRRKSKYIVENIVRGANGTPTVYLTEVLYEQQEPKAETAHRGGTEGTIPGDHTGESRSSAETETSKMQRLPSQNPGDSHLQNLPEDNSRGNFGRRKEVRGVQPEINPTDSVGAAPSGFDPSTHLQYQYGTLPEGENAVRSDDLPVSTDGNNRVSQTAVTVKGAKVTSDELADLLTKDVTEKNGMTYIPITNDATVQKAFDHITEEGWEAAKALWHADVRSGKAGADLSATGALLLNNAAKAGDKAAWLNILHDYQLLGTNTAQGLQALRILKQLTPSDKLYMAKRSVKQMVKDMKLDTDVTIDPELEAEYTAAETDSQRDAVLKKIQKNVAQQLPTTFMEKFTALRYVNMLGNLRTQGRNIVGNLTMKGTRAIHNTIAAGIEAVANKVSDGKTGRTRSVTVSKEQRAAAARDFESLQEYILDGGKYSDNMTATGFARGVQEQKQIFKFKPLEGYRKVTNWMMEQGDLIFAKDAYARALAGYLKANGVNETDYSKVDPAIMDDARLFAAKEAQEATFRDTNWLSGWVSKIGRRKDTPAVGKLLSEGIMPFRKTPANVLVRAEEYSPLGIVNSVVLSVKAARKGSDVTATQVINSWAKTLTGTGLFGVGMLLQNIGLLSAGPDDDEQKEDFEDLNGWQNYALTLPDGTNLTIDCFSPSAIPVLMGAQFMREIRENGFSLKDLETALTSIADPLVEMSMLQGVNDSLENIQYADNNLGQFLINAALSYLTQGLTNTFFGQIERSFEDSRMQTYVDKDSDLPAWLQRTLGKASAKTPVWDYSQIPYINAWGEEEENPSTGLNLIYNLLSPSYFDKGKDDDLTRELNRLHDAQNDVNVYPSTPGKTLTIDEQDYNLSADEYVELAKLQGQTQKQLVQDIIGHSAYADLSDEDKAKAISYAYDYARDFARGEVVEGHPGITTKWMAEIEGDPGYTGADTIISKVVSTGITDAFSALTDSWSNGSEYASTVDDLEEAYSVYKKLSAAAREEISEEAGGRLEYYLTARENGISSKTFVDLYKTFYDIGGDDGNASSKASKWSYELEKAQERGTITTAQKNVLKENMNFWQMIPAETKRFDALTDSGLSADKSAYITEILGGLFAEAGSSTVRIIQKVEAIAGADDNLTEAEQKTAMKSVLDDNAYAKYEKILALGMDTDDYAASYRIYLDEQDTGGKGTKARTIQEFQKEFGISYDTAKSLYEIYKPAS